ncbi:hypothetical protein [Merdimonas faecis]|uniref:hypothetical protein n=1 Tax=Merdimonas faecis TaxID=1653435 RepID=UPI0008635993|nr:hypothetical protein [Merdimonas faecis]
MSPYDAKNSESNIRLTCIIINPEAMCRQVRGERKVLYITGPQRSCSIEVLETLASCNAER